jgi:hypothetical protein
MQVVDESPWTIEDVARCSSVTDKTAYQLAQSDRIPAFNRSWLEERRQPDTAGAKTEAKRSRSWRAK